MAEPDLSELHSKGGVTKMDNKGFGRQPKIYYETLDTSKIDLNNYRTFILYVWNQVESFGRLTLLIQNQSQRLIPKLKI